MKLESRKIVICVNTAWNLVNFRTGLIQALIAAGHEVVAVAPNDAYAHKLETLGCRFVALEMPNGGTNPVADGLLTWRFLRLLARERPSVYLGYTVKPNVYGSLAAHILGIPVVNNIAGLGIVFGKDGWLLKIVQQLYRTALKHSAKVFFQNADDKELFVREGLVRAEITDLLPGSGVDLNRFSPAPMPQRNKDLASFRFLMITRMLRDKGVAEYVEAAKLIRQQWPQIECCLLGPLDVKNPAAVSNKEMDIWVESGAVKYLGTSDDVRKEIAEADCIVLPSYYREGTPRTLLEAASMARPIITTNAVGCKDVVDDGINGHLCQPRDSSDLAKQMERILSLSSDQRKEMGLKGRKKMEVEFDEKIVTTKYLTVIENLLVSKTI